MAWRLLNEEFMMDAMGIPFPMPPQPVGVFFSDKHKLIKAKFAGLHVTYKSLCFVTQC
jgi:hypothetical protein